MTRIRTRTRTRSRAATAALAGALGLVLAFAGPAAAEDPPLPTVSEITAHLDDLFRSKSSIATMTMDINTKHYQRTLTLDAWSQGEDYALMVIRKPARDAGVATLRTEEGLWNYAPRSDRLVRVPTALLGDAWMGSHFTNDDLMRENSWEDDYDSRLAWVSEGGTRTLQITMTPKPDAPVVYTKVVQILSADGWLPVRADYYDDDEIVRRMHFSDVKDFGGRKIPAVLKVVPSDKPNEATTVTYEKMQFDAPVDKAIFTPRGLRRAAQGR